VDALRVVPACGAPGSIVRVASLALERALVADPALAAAGIAAWLGPLERGGRGSEVLLPTLEAWFAESGSVTGTARRLGVAPRTVAYRLTRIARVLGLPALDLGARERLGTALLMRRLLAGTPAGPAASAGETASPKARPGPAAPRHRTPRADRTRLHGC
jgi:hypothetical protein